MDMKRVGLKRLSLLTAIAAGALLLVAVACGSDKPAATAAPAPTAAPAATATKAAAVATATTAPAPTVPAKVVPTGTVTGVIGGLGVGTPSGWPTDCLWCASIVMAGAQEALFAYDYDAAGVPGVQPWLAESWTTSPDMKYTDIKLKKGVMFHQGFGELTSADVVYTYQAGMPSYTKEARHDTLPNPALSAVDAVDTYTVRFTWAAYNGLTLIDFTDANEGIGIFPKKALDTKGVEWMRVNVVGTGPFEMTEWTAQKIIDLKATPEHWKHTSKVARVKLLEIPEDSTRRAMLESGEADFGEVPLKDWKPLIAKGYKKSNEGITNGIEIIMGGQYWAKTQSGTDTALDTTGAGGAMRKIDTSKPWIGNPFASDCNQDDLLLNAKPKGPVCPSMEIPRLFRWALAEDIDREGITQALAQGEGGPLYIRVNPNDPISKANPGRWPVKYDPAAAKAKMKQAFPNGLPGPIQWWDGPSGLEVEVSEAVAAQWLTDLGVKTEFDRRVYTAQRPNMVDRTSLWLQTRNCCSPGTRILAEEWIFSSAVPTGYNHAQELPFAGKIYQQKIKEQDLKKIESLTAEMIDHHHFWMIDIGVTAPPATTLYNGNKLEWKQRPYIAWRLGGMRNSLDYLKLTK